MRDLSLVQLHMGLRNLLGERKAALEMSAVGVAYVPIFNNYLVELGEVVVAIEGAPFADELSHWDGEHDGWLKAMIRYSEMVIEMPDLDEACRELGQTFKDTLPPLRTSQRSYIEEANTAGRVSEALRELAPRLDEKLPAPGAPLSQWIERYIESGEKLEALLSARAKVVDEIPQRAITMRPMIIGALNRLRDAIADEMTYNDALPDNYEQQVFGYFDQLTK